VNNTNTSCENFFGKCVCMREVHAIILACRDAFCKCVVQYITVHVNGMPIVLLFARKVYMNTYERLHGPKCTQSAWNKNQI
jgi:UDP-N-acetyl-D-mannosaminuronic acid transferase (WecB/TagA/CpsF family)